MVRYYAIVLHPSDDPEDDILPDVIFASEDDCHIWINTTDNDKVPDSAEYTIMCFENPTMTKEQFDAFIAQFGLQFYTAPHTLH